ncbi:MAG: hypothetical protein ACRD19_01425 [Terriglobia bacterium]
MGVTFKEGFGRPWSEALLPRIADAVNSDPAFKDAFKADPLAAVVKRFGADSLPVSEIKVVRAASGGYLFVMPGEEGVWDLDANLNSPPEGQNELSDAMLEYVSAGSCVGPQPSPIPTSGG